MNIKLTIAYDGSRYLGWQRLKDSEKTIQGKLEDVLSKLLECAIEISGAGRTDAGVHAKGQVANFQVDETYLEEKICQSAGTWREHFKKELPSGKADEWLCSALQTYMNHYLPEDIVVLQAEVMPERFHSRLSATGKWYRYRIRNQKVSDVFSRKYVHHVTETLDIAAMQKAANILVGTQDFLPYSSLKKTKKSTVRTIRNISISQEDGEIIFDYVADGFLYNMVRIITGTLIEVGLHQRDEETLKDALQNKKRCLAGSLAPAKGLCLMQVFYDK